MASLSPVAAATAEGQRRCLLLLAAVLVSSVRASSDRVPVLVWTNDRSVTFPQHLAGHSVKRHEFQNSYVKDLTLDNQDNIVVFMQDELTVMDFAHFSDVFHSDEEKNSFKNVKSLMSEMTSTFLPSVHNPASVLMEVENLKSRKVRILDDPQDILLEDDDEPHLIIVKLPKLHHHSRKSFSHLDNMIGAVSLQLKALTRPFIAFYTAALSSKDTSHQSHHKGRHLMEDSVAVSAIFVNVSDTFYFYTQNLTLGNDSIATLSVDDKYRECNDTAGNCEIVLKFDDIGNSLFDPQIRFQFNVTSDSFWYLSQFTLEYWKAPNVSNSPDAENYVQTVDYRTDFVYQTPMGLSFHCNHLPLIPDKNDSTSLSFQFNKFQIQPFVREGDRGRFGHYNDCVGFFTVGTWMFLISAVIMIAILFFGVIMLLNVSTQDRFDDAKGKTITVTSAEG